MASLVRLTALRNAKKYFQAPLVLSRAMSGVPHEGGPPTTTLGGPFKVPVGTGHATQEEISNWVKKELESGWQSKGYDYNDEKLDNEWHRLWMFCLVSIPVIFVTFYCYLPNRTMRDWAIREAYLVLAEREAAGVEPISRDLVDPEKILAALPSDEEFKAAGVVINI
uniref:NADH dehydrogenase [ubiquinone] 1 beta subcomplex subunit 11, mitochondrial n=1 Tax=Calanus sinicus TaxID=114070 RepID=A0A0U2T6D4_CALSV|nr:NADH dehydrogenase [Calanus sinicus]